MKKIVILLVLLQGMVLMPKAQTYSVAMEGTVWQYVSTSVSSFNLSGNIVDGDTLVNGHQYKKVYMYSTPQYNRDNATFYCAFREEGDKIYALPSDRNEYLPLVNGETLLYDFSLNEGDKFGDNDLYTVKKVDNIQIDGKSRKRITFDYFDNWIEGIGSLERAFGCPLEPIPTNGSVTTLEMFGQNGKTVYGSRRFNLLTDGVHWTERASSEMNSQPGEMNPYFDMIDFHITGDSVINGTIYKKVYRDGAPYMNLREGKDGKIYYHYGNGDYLLYDFGCAGISGQALKAINLFGEEVAFQAGIHNYSRLQDEHYYEYIQVSYPSPYFSHTEDIRLYRGLGLTSGIFHHLFAGSINCICFNDLVSVYNSENKLVYQNPLFKENGEFVTSISLTRANTNLSIVNNGKEVLFTLKDASSRNTMNLMIYDISGRLQSIRSMEKGYTVINDLPTGIYIYQFDTEKGQFAVGK